MVKQLFRCAKPLLWLSILFLTSAAWQLGAQVRFEASAPSAVALDEQFQITFTLHGATSTAFQAPAFEGLNVLFPPGNAISQQNLNGKKKTTFTGTFMGQKEGTVQVGEASITVGGKTYRSKPLTIKVLPAEGRGKKQDQASSRISSNDIFIRVIPSAMSVYEQQALLLTFKLYTRTGRMNFENVKFPQYDGFIEEDLPIDTPIQLAMEHYNGRNYYTAVLKRSLIFPQRTGRLIVPRGQFDIEVAVEQEITDIESFFGFSAPTLLKKTITSPELAIESKALPEPRPKSFTNAVGDFAISLTAANPEGLKSNEILTLRLDIQGKGNIKLVSPPEVKFPESFETYDPKSTTEISSSAEGVRGVKSFEYNIIPRNRGTYTIAPIAFSYFDPSRGSYVTKHTEPITLTIAQGASDLSSKQSDVELLGNDIAYLRPYAESASASTPHFLASPLRFIPYLLITLVAIAAGVYYRRRLARRSDVAGSRRRTASRRVQKHFRQISASVAAGSTESFYHELPQVIYGYLGDKFTIPTHQLSLATIRETLLAHGVASESVASLLTLLERVGAAAYAGKEDRPTPESLLEASITIIETIDKTAPKR